MSREVTFGTASFAAARARPAAAGRRSSCGSRGFRLPGPPARRAGLVGEKTSGYTLPPMSSLRCTVVTPADSVFDGEVTYASVPAHDGQFGVLPGQSPLVAKMGIGILRLDLPGGGQRWYQVDGGFAQVTGEVVTILTERAIARDAIDAEAAERDLKEANRMALEGRQDRTQVEAEQARARARLRLVRG